MRRAGADPGARGDISTRSTVPLPDPREPTWLGAHARDGAPWAFQPDSRRGTTEP